MCLRWGVLGPLVAGRSGAVASPRDFHCDGGAPWNVDAAARTSTGRGRYDGSRPGRGRSGLGALALGALGVVFGDIGTSPLYAGCR